MATSLLRLGRLCPLKLESWAVLRTHSVASFCTKAEEPTKPVKKTKAASKTAEAPDERETLIAYKTAVAFPLRLSQPGLFPTHSLGVAEQLAAATVPLTAASDPRASPILDVTVADPKVDVSIKTPATDDPPVEASGNVVPPVTASSELNDLAADGSSSSSSSSSDSDSDSEDEKSEVKTETKNSAPELTESMVKEDAEVKDVISEVKTDTIKDEKELSPRTKCSPASDDAQARVNVQVLVDSSPEICTVTRNISEATSSKVSAESTVEVSPEVTEYTASPAVSVAPVQISSADAPDVTMQPISEAATEAAGDVSGHVEELVDCASVIAETTEERLQAEAPVEASDESAAAPPEPEEPFDNSTYKNYQHHSYTPYTFVDMDVDMAKFRLPQPSSGRPSPRH